MILRIGCGCDRPKCNKCLNSVAGLPATLRTLCHLTSGNRKPGRVQSWREVTALSCGDWHSAGVRADGSALAAGNNRRGQCAVEGWRDIVAVAAGSTHTLGLRADGTVLSTGSNAGGQCDTGSWSEIHVQGT
jgi:alpha-tubulin suppressor-like RCC1 family protein